ncbi:M12 family metallopeptidase [Isoptericola sp. AK164]|uniref:M12 family metallopeptidase n=1 Tax=Isoptericola sp. AK164 TaxID=3024246 RepID=UPI002418147B|nr:M12 family metallopeptidase [Isoptericola sp. AK164]
MTRPDRPADGWTYCDVRPQSRPALPPDLNPRRASLIHVTRAKWVNGTVLHYWLEPAAPQAQHQAVRDAFRTWEDLGIGLRFVEVDDADRAEVRIAFDQGAGSWSYVGKDVLGIPQHEATMNFGWDLTTSWGAVTALHEIGHTLGFPHEHQNPNAGIVWDEQRVLQEFTGPPNSWTEDQVRHNILRKLSPEQVEGSAWDPESVMHYPFDPGLIVSPEQYGRDGIPAPDGLSDDDREWVLRWYPGLEPDLPTLEPGRSVPLELAPAGQADLVVRPTATREYRVGTFGDADTLLVLFEEVDGEPVFLAGDDDSGTDRNALVTVRLRAGRSYVVRVRLYWAWAAGTTAVMLW